MISDIDLTIPHRSIQGWSPRCAAAATPALPSQSPGPATSAAAEPPACAPGQLWVAHVMSAGSRAVHAALGLRVRALIVRRAVCRGTQGPATHGQRSAGATPRGRQQLHRRTQHHPNIHACPTATHPPCPTVISYQHACPSLENATSITNTPQPKPHPNPNMHTSTPAATTAPTHL